MTLQDDTTRKGGFLCLKLPSIELVTVLLLIFCTPRITFQKRDVRKYIEKAVSPLGMFMRMREMQNDADIWADRKFWRMAIPTHHAHVTCSDDNANSRWFDCLPHCIRNLPGQPLLHLSEGRLPISRDCKTWSRLQNISTILASLERPSTLKKRVYFLTPTEKEVRLWMDHLAARKIPDGYMANDGDQVVLTQTG